MSKPLTPKQAAFVEEYLKDLCATQAATRAGYSKKTARQQGERLLSNVDIAAAVETAMNARSERTELDADLVVKELRSIAECCMALEETKAGRRMVNPTAAIRALELLGRHIGMFTNKVEHSGKLEMLSDAEIKARIAELTEVCEPSVAV